MIKQINEISRKAAKGKTEVETPIGVVTVEVGEALNNLSNGRNNGSMMRRVSYKLNGKRIAYAALVKSL